MWTTAEPVVREWIDRNLGPAGRLEQAGGAIAALGRLAGQMPELARRAERLSLEFDQAAARGMRLDPATVEDIGEQIARHDRSGRVALWVIAFVGAVAVAATLVSVLR
jgi:ubiquinone biosynthesis protein